MCLILVLIYLFVNIIRVEYNLNLRYYRIRKIIFYVESKQPKFYLDHQIHKHNLVDAVIQVEVLILLQLELVLIYSVYLTLENYIFFQKLLHEVNFVEYFIFLCSFFIFLNR